MIPPMSVFCFLDLTQPQAMHIYPQAIPLLEFTVKVGLPANKTHVDLQRNGEGQGPENSLSLYPSTHMHAQEQLHSYAHVL